MKQFNLKYSTSSFPKTRYQGSKYKLVHWIKDNLQELEFDSVLDAFGGTASVSYMFKKLGKRVIYNDILKFNHYVGKALIENNSEKLTEKDISFILTKSDKYQYDNFIERTFSDIYYTDEENRWLDIITQNILLIDDEYKKSMAFWALFQACISKRPYNLFHRKNLYVRTSNIKRSFGNKTTWDKSFERHFKNFVQQINEAIFDNKQPNKAICLDAVNINEKIDLVYIDPPYIPKKGTLTLYRDFYHFLEGLVGYHHWQPSIDYHSKHKKLLSQPSPWEDKKLILNEFSNMIEQFQKSILVISYREDGIPSIDEISFLLQTKGKAVTLRFMDYQYALSKNKNKEVLIIAS